MPELPEVEIFKRFVDSHAVGHTVESLQVLQPKILHHVTPDAMKTVVEGACLSGTLRQGKYLFIQLERSGGGKKKAKEIPAWVLLHFGMTGYLSWFNDEKNIVNAYGDPTRTKNHIRLQFDLDDGSHLAFHEQRMFGWAELVDDPEAYATETKLGPDALDMSKADFTAALTKKKGQIKPVLMDQSMVSGVGNVYADELLYQCKIHPERRIADLSDKDIDCLYQEMVEVLQKTVDCKADRKQLPVSYLTHDRGKNGRCPRDKTLLEIKQVGGRTTYFCPKCQK